MKRWIQLTAALIFTLGIQTSASAWTGQCESEAKIIKEKQSGYMVLSRMDLSMSQFHLVFYGPATRSPEQVVVRIYDGVTGAQVFVEVVQSQGGGQAETFDISYLEEGPYDLSVVSGKYNLEESFVLQ